MIKSFYAPADYFAKNNSILGSVNIISLIPQNLLVSDAWIHTGGWQSWNPGYEIEKKHKQPDTTSIIKGWDQYLIFPQSVKKSSKNIVLAQFVSYLRWGDFYLVFASTGNKNNSLPPVQFIINKQNKTVSFEIADKNHYWNKNDLQAEIEIFTADSFFEVKSKLKKLYDCNQFESLTPLGNNIGGFESWYNHYTNINQKMIYEDLDALKNGENIISKGNFSSVIFQIDDGWEKQLGNWEWDTNKFPDNPRSITQKIEEKSYISGLWIAPFIADSRSPVAKEHPDWLLRDKNGKLVKAGYNPFWGEKGYFYAFDLSIKEAVDWIDSNIQKAIDEWGFRYLKFDFLYAGMIYGIHKNQDASYFWYNQAIKKITCRKQSKEGKPVFYLGCGVPFEQSYKYLPLSRIGCDTYEHWENRLLKFIKWNGRNSACLNLKDTLGHALWNKSIFMNDPDVIFIRENNCSLTCQQKLLIGFVNTIFGSQIMYSDDPSEQSTFIEKELTDKILAFKKQFENEEFGINYLGKEQYLIFSKSGNYSFKIDLNEGKMEEKKYDNL